MTKEEFDQIVQEEVDALPSPYCELDNVRVIVEDEPSARTLEKMRMNNRSMLLGLYEGVPRPHRGTAYGMYPVVPDTITLFMHNIVKLGGTPNGIREQIKDTLIHEIGHYYGLSEAEIRNAGY